MDIRLKAFLVIVPFLLAGYVGFSLLQPAIDDANSKSSAVEEKSKESADLVAKLQAESKLKIKEQELQSEIDKLRDSVPKSPETDLLTIDLEKMCKDAGMDFVSIAPPKADNNVAPVAKEEKLKASQNKLKNALAGNAANAIADAAGAGKGDDALSGGSDLEESPKQVVVVGDYNGLQKLVHELETYQRVIKIDEIESHVPKKEASAGKNPKLPDDQVANEQDDLGDPSMLYVSMKITTYYLP